MINFRTGPTLTRRMSEAENLRHAAVTRGDANFPGVLIGLDWSLNLAEQAEGVMAFSRQKNLHSELNEIEIISLGEELRFDQCSRRRFS